MTYLINTSLSQKSSYTLLGILLVLLWVDGVYGQNRISFRNLSVKDGLSQNSAIAVAQDSLGYLWVATQDGLNRYDGREFKTYPFQFVDVTRPTYSHLGQLYLDREGGLWAIPLDRKLHLLPQGGDKFTTVPELEDVFCIYQDTQKNYWVGSYEGQLYRKQIGEDTFTEVLQTSGLEGPVQQFLQTAPDRLWVLGTHEILAIDLNTMAVVARTSLPPTTGELLAFSKMVEDQKGTLWLGTYGHGLYQLHQNGTELSLVTAPAIRFPHDGNVLDLFLDTNNRLWVATYGQGLFCYDAERGETQHFVADKNNDQALSYNDVLCIAQDYLGVLWFGTDGAGLSYYDAHLEKFNAITNDQTPEDIHVDVVRAITEAPDGTIWVGTSGKGLTAYHPQTKKWQTYNTANSGLGSNRIMSLFWDAEGTLWIGTQGGGLFFRDADGDFSSPTQDPENPLHEATIWTIFKDAQQRMWLGTRDHGLVRYHKQLGILGRWTAEGTEAALPSNNIKVIAQDAAGDLWLGTEAHGLVRWDVDGEKGQRYTTPQLTTDALKSLYIAPDQKIWIGTYGKGLDVLDPKTNTVVNYTMAHGLPNNVIYSVMPDADGHLWLSSNKGISKLSPTPKGPEITNYNNYDGLATEFNTGAWYRSPKGTLFFGGLDGFYWFNPNSIKTSRQQPITRITKFEVVDSLLPLQGPHVLEHDANTVSFTFSSMQFSLPVRNQYRYRLLDYDRGWIASGNKNYVRYPKLPPGAYEFQVISSNYDGIWGTQMARMPFTIRPPWYLTTYAKIGYGLVILLLLFLGYAYLKWRWKMQWHLEQKEAEATRLQELHRFKSALYTNIAHEFKTPLTLITAPMETGVAHGQASLVERNLKRLEQLVDQLLHLGKLEEGKHQKRAIYGELSHFLKALVGSYAYKAAQKGLQLQTKIGATGMAWYDEDMLEKVLGNLLGNALKYSAPKSSIHLETHLEGEQLVLHVGNTMAGNLDPEKLFDRFYQADPQKEGMGIGLALVKELVQAYQGSIRAKQEGNQIGFEVKIPIHQEAFATTERRPITAQGDILPQQNKETTAAQKPLLLIVEDDVDMREYMAQSLAPNYAILQAKNGQEGWELATAQLPEVIVTDLKMPIMDGLALCQRLKNDPRTGHIPILILTGTPNEQKELEALQVGADDYISKPFKTSLLTQRIHNTVAARRLWAERYAQELVIQPKNVRLTSTEDEFLKKVQTVLDGHLTDPQFNAAQMGKLVGLSRMQLHRKLQAYTGLSTTGFIRSQRIKLASKILLESDRTISEVAYSVGFNTPDYFMKSFKAHFKMTPSEYQQKYQQA